jgi:hypothetical protein
MRIPPPGSLMWTAREGATAIFAFMTNFALYPCPLVKPPLSKDPW